MIIREIHGWEEIAELGPSWDQLHADGLGAHLFNGFAFYDIWQGFFAQETPVFVLVAETAEGTLAGLLPLQLTTIKRGPVSLRRLACPRNAFMSRTSLLAHPDHTDAVAQGFANHLGSMTKQFDDFSFENMLRDCPAQIAFRRALAGQGLRVTLEAHARPLRAIAATDDFDAYLQARPKTVRKDNRRAMNRTAELDDFRITYWDKAEDAREVARRLFSFDWMSAKRGKPGAVFSPQDKLFHAELLQRSVDFGGFEYGEASIDGIPVGGVLGVRCAGRNYGLLVYTDQSKQKLNLGRRLFLDYIRRTMAGPEPLVADLNGESMILEQLSDDCVHLVTLKATHGHGLSRIIGLGRQLRRRKITTKTKQEPAA
jgi:hypothetical protein